MIVHEAVHFSLSLLAVGTVYFFSRKNFWPLWLAALLSGFFVDGDHLFDYFMYKGSFNFNLAEFFSASYFTEHAYVLLHGFEYAILLFLAAFCIKYLWKKSGAAAPLLAVLALSLSFHLIFDMIQYKPRWQTYFISYRLLHNFELSSFRFQP